MQKSLLDINPEGVLLREIKDIMDELFMMSQIKIQEVNIGDYGLPIHIVS